MTHKRKRTPGTAPASNQKYKSDDGNDRVNLAKPQPRPSAYAQAIRSKRHIVLACLKEKTSSVGNQYFIGRLQDSPIVMLRADLGSEWTLFLRTPGAKRDTEESGLADGGENGGTP